MNKFSLYFEIIFAVIICVLQGCTSKNDSPKVIVNVNVGPKQKENETLNDRNLYYPINIDILNNSDSTIHFWLMKCSWEDNFISNSKNILLLDHECDGNFPIRKTISANGKLQLDWMLRSLSNSPSPGKLGFVIVRDYSPLQDGNFFEIVALKASDNNNVIWSNEFICN
jgi:hypothetical protein